MNLFAYGTLMWPEIISDVIGRSIDGRPAVLKDVRRLRVHNEVYPSLVTAPGREVCGTVYAGLSSEEVSALDVFEGPEYDRRDVCILVDGVEMNAATYFTSEAGMALLEEEEWTPDHLPPELMNRFRSSYKGWAERVAD